MASKRLPEWIRKKMQYNRSFMATDEIINSHGIQTICTNAKCPNKGECWSRGTATVLIMGNICTRNCPFCAVGHGKPEPLDMSEPERVAKMVKEMGITYLVITSVDRDDLLDGGASQFRDVMDACRNMNDDIRFEILTPDFKGSQAKSLEILSSALPFVFSHNIETVSRLYPTARPGGVYERTLRLLNLASIRYPNTPIKSSIMLGLGETEAEVIEVLEDLHEAGCTRVAMGQYLKPDRDSLEVKEYVTPEKFEWWEKTAREIGFDWVMSSPFTRSSYHADA